MRFALAVAGCARDSAGENDHEQAKCNIPFVDHERVSVGLRIRAAIWTNTHSYTNTDPDTKFDYFHNRKIVVFR